MAEPPSFDETSLDIYYKEVEATSMLTAKDERELLLKYRDTKDAKEKRKAQDLIIKGALRYVISEARKHPRSGNNQTVLEDLIAAGNIGLIRALKKFDPSCGTRFLTYAGWWVRHEMREEARRIGLLHVPAHAITKGVKSPPTVEFTENTANEQADSEDRAGSIDLHRSIVKLLELTQLSTREIFIIKTCYGIHTPPKTLKQIGKILDITGERVRQLREAALARMRITAEQHGVTFR
jgi:RNA polymerase primary sigma factor